MYDVYALRKQFPLLQELVNKHPLVYLDNAASTQKPLCVLEASRDYYEHTNANIHRGVHSLSQKATSAHEAARQTVADFLHAPSAKEVIFTSGCTESINLVAEVLQRSGKIQAGDEVLISQLEHHSNIVPWQFLCQATGAQLKILPLKKSGEWDLDALPKLLSSHTKVVALSQVSNALGIINPVKEVIAQAKQMNPEVITLIDGAQSVAHLIIDVLDLGCDFFAFSGHKIYAPTGIGVLWGREALLNDLPPWKGGGEMIAHVSFEKTTFNELPFKYEAGTPNIEGAIALAEALRFVQNLGIETIEAHEEKLALSCLNHLRTLPGLTIIGESAHRAGVVSFIVEGVHPYDLGVLLDQMGIAVRTGHHCCQPLMEHYGIVGTVRVSFALYNTEEEVECFLESLKKALSMLR